MAVTRYTLKDLTEQAGVSSRTVRYYISEGLLPPPVAGGARSYYTQGQLNRLLLIGRLKERFLPLREIRRILAGLEDDDVDRMLSEPHFLDVDAIPHADLAAPYDVRESDSASAYIARAMAREPEMPRHLPSPPPAAPEASQHEPRFQHAPVTRRAEIENSTWRRVQLSHDLELLVREEAWDRHRDRIEWLIDWARRVVD